MKSRRHRAIDKAEKNIISLSNFGKSKIKKEVKRFSLETKKEYYLLAKMILITFEQKVRHHSKWLFID